MIGNWLATDMKKKLEKENRDLQNLKQVIPMVDWFKAHVDVMLKVINKKDAEIEALKRERDNDQDKNTLGEQLNEAMERWRT